MTVEQPLESGPIPFLDLLLAVGTDSIEMRAASEESAEPAQLLESAPPKDIADALIRSMFVSVEYTMPLPKTAAITTSEFSAPVQEQSVEADIPIDRAEDWDLPFDWIAPEELTDPEALEVADVQRSVQPELVQSPFVPPTFEQPPADPVSGNKSSELPVAPRTTRALTVEEAPVGETSTRAEAGARQSVSPAPAPTQKRPAPEPLAFALNLKVKAAPEFSNQATVRQPAPDAVTQPRFTLPDEASQQAVPPAPLAVERPERRIADTPAKAMLAAQNLPEETPVIVASSDNEPDRQQSGRQREGAEARPLEEPTHRNAALPTAPAATPPPVSAVPLAHSPIERQSAPAVTPPPVPAQSTVEVEMPAKPEVRSGPVKEIAVRISPPTALPVDLQVRSRGGEVQVAVHTADVELKTSLRQDLSSLVDRLDRSGFQTEAVMTRESAMSRVESVSSFNISSGFRMASETTTSGNDRPPDSPRDGDSSGGYQNSESGARQQRRQQNPQQKWTETMEEED